MNTISNTHGSATAASTANPTHTAPPTHTANPTHESRDAHETQQHTEAITPAEWELMRIIWTVGSIPTRDIIVLMQQKRDWSESTIKTLLSRLTKKGFLATERENRKFIYHAVIPENQAMDDSAAQLFDHLCSMKKGKALINLVRDQAMSKTDIRAMIAVLEEKLPDAPDAMTCDCLPPSARMEKYDNQGTAVGV